MRIAMTTDTVGGVWTFTCELAASLLADGHSIALVSFGGPLHAHQREWMQATASRFGERFMMRESDAPLEWMQDNQRSFPDGADVLAATIAEFGADLLHANQFCWGALSRCIPCVITAHSDVLTWADACKPQGLGASTWLDRYCDLMLRGLGGADAVIAPTRWMLSALQQHVPLRCAHQVIPNGRTVPRPDRWPVRAVQAVTAGRLWDEAKGLDTVLAARSAMPILIAGDQGREDAGEHPGFRFLGPLSTSALLSRFRESSVYIVASIYEPFGLAPLEAAQCGCAIVARNIPSLREVWGDCATYFETSSDLADVLETFLHSPALLHDARVRAMERASLYPSERMARSYMTVYRSLLSCKAANARGQEVPLHAA